MTDRYDNIYEVEEATPPPSAGERAGALGSMLIGAVLCVVVVAGLGYWLIDLGDRDAASLPVFQAEIYPAKTRPEDPGGAETPYQSIRSYDVAAGSAADPVETNLAPAPETPAKEDVAMAALSTEAAAPAQPVPSEPASEPAASPSAPVSEPAPRQPARQTAATPPVPPPVRPREQPQPSAASSSQQAIDEAAQLAARAALSPVQIQLGAFTDRSYTEAEWRRISAANEDILGGRALAIQSTVSGGAKYYRLRVGPFRDRAEAKTVCEALKARGQDCLVAVNG